MAWASPNLAVQAAYLQHLGTAPRAEVIERDGIFAVRTCVRSNGENGVVSGAGAHVTRGMARQCGVGRALALARLREAREDGCELAQLSPIDGAALYEALAFESVPVPADRWFYAPLRAAPSDAP